MPTHSNTCTRFPVSTGEETLDGKKINGPNASNGLWAPTLTKEALIAGAGTARANHELTRGTGDCGELTVFIDAGSGQHIRVKRSLVPSFVVLEESWRTNSNIVNGDEPP